MPIGGSLLLIAVGAILKWAITVHHTHGFNVNTAGVILMVVGAIGLVISLIWMSARRRTDIVERDATGTRATTYRTPPPAEPI
jgi:hypothetical protein